MIFFPSNTRVFLAPGSTDMRKAISTLSILVEYPAPRSVFRPSFLFLQPGPDDPQNPVLGPKRVLSVAEKT
jgi:hypothetical protein